MRTQSKVNLSGFPGTKKLIGPKRRFGQKAADAGRSVVDHEPKGSHRANLVRSSQALLARSDGAHMFDEPLEPIIERGRHRIKSGIIVIEQAHR